jgi:hypothetical protein
MSHNIESYGLELLITGQETAVDATKKLEALEKAALELAQAYNRGDISQTDFLEKLKPLNADIRANEQAIKILAAAQREQEEASRKAAASEREQAEALDRLKQAERDTAAAAQALADKERLAGEAAAAAGRKVSATAQDLNRAKQGALDTARAVQDFTQGGFGGILNNLEGLGRGLPALLKNPMSLLTSLPTVLTLVGVGLYTFGGQVYQAFRHFALGSNEIPKATDALGQIDGRLKDVTKQLDAYREAHVLTNWELKEYNRLSAEQVVLERQKGQALLDVANAKKFAESNPGKEEDEKKRAEMFGTTLGTPQQREEMVRSIESALPKDVRIKLAAELQGSIRAQQEFAAGDSVANSGDLQRQSHRNTLAQRTDKAREALQAENKRQEDEARKIAVDAVTGGSAGARRTILDLQARRPDAFSDYQKFAVQNADPEQARKDAADVANQKRMAGLDKDLKAKADRDYKAEFSAAEKELVAEIKEASRDFGAEFAAAKKELEAEIKAGEKDRKHDETLEDDARKADRKTIDQSGLGTRAAALYAQAKVGGASPDQAFDLVNQQALDHLNRQIGTDKFGRPVRANPGMSDARKQQIAMQIASAGRDDVNQRMLATSGKVGDNVNKLLSVAASLNGDLAAQNARIDQQTAQINALGQQVLARTQSGRNRGRGG